MIETLAYMIRSKLSSILIKKTQNFGVRLQKMANSIKSTPFKNLRTLLYVYTTLLFTLCQVSKEKCNDAQILSFRDCFIDFIISYLFIYFLDMSYLNVFFVWYSFFYFYVKSDCVFTKLM